MKNKGEHHPNIGLLYQLAYSALEKSMGARKNLRDFKQKEEHGKKCHKYLEGKHCTIKEILEKIL